MMIMFKMVLNFFVNSKKWNKNLPQHQTRLSGRRLQEILGNIKACAKVFNQLKDLIQETFGMNRKKINFALSYYTQNQILNQICIPSIYQC